MLGVSMKWVVLWSLWAARLVPQYSEPLRVESGLVRGVVTPGGHSVGYTGLPYATVEKRFQIAKPVSPWSGVFNAVNEHIRCPQRFFSSKVLGVEDCLTLNIYTPLSEPSPLPVMVFIHGGGFRDGSGSTFIYSPEYLIRHDVILVTFNYRLEVLGFLCLGIKEAPGNAGLKDQVAALRWLKENIAVFGGDSNDITIFGESAGSASVGYHLVSPMSKGLFQKAIMQSGSPISPWALQFEPLETARKLARQMGIFTDDPKEIYEQFKDVTEKSLLEARVPRKEGDIVLSENIFVPCVENPLPNVESFLIDTPYNIINKGKHDKVPLIIGYNSNEGLMFAGKENDISIRQLDFYKALPRDLDIPTEAEKRRISDVLNKYYMGDKMINKETLADFAKYEGDSSIAYPVVFTTDMLLKTAEFPVYIYKFKYSGWLNLAKIAYGFGKEPGASHADELFYLFNVETPLLTAYLERGIIDTMTRLWTNFAKYGDPTPPGTPLSGRWLAADKKNPQVLELDSTCSRSPLWQEEIFTFWNETYSKYRRKK